MPLSIIGELSPLIETPNIHENALSSATWRSLGDGVQNCFLENNHCRHVALLRAEEDAIITELLAGVDLSNDYAVTLILRGQIEYGRTTAGPLDLVISRPHDQEEFFVSAGTLAVVAHTGTKSKPMPGGPIHADLSPFFDPLMPTEAAHAALQPKEDGTIGEIAFRSVQREIVAGMYHEPRTCQAYPIRFGDGGAVSFVLAGGEHYDGTNCQPEGSCYVLGPRDVIKSQNRKKSWFISIFNGELSQA